ncbi:MAG TPA: DUF4010 domain-containing protein [Terriglobales bacterium]|nr:DUF4010 domain-containing protein [Terriglobales bacterium]
MIAFLAWQVRFPVNAVALKLAVSISIGMLVGLEREWSNKDIGIRTFALIALLGLVCGLIGPEFSLLGLGVVISLILLVNIRSILTDRSLEITTSAALAVTFVLGVLVGQGHTFTPVASAILMTMLLAWKTELRRFAGGITPDEIRSAVLLCLIGFVIYPILPDRNVDPWDLFNPREAWVTVIIIAGLGFFNYVLMKMYSAKGLKWTAILGGLVNSTATVAEISSLGRSISPQLVSALVLITVVAMFARNIAIVAILSRHALLTAVPPLLVMSIPALIMLWRTGRRSSAEAAPLKLSSPLSVPRVLTFGGVFVLIQVIGTLGQRFLGSSGFLAATTIGGFVSSASAAAAAANLSASGKVSATVGGIGVVLASVTSAIVNLPIVARQLRDRTLSASIAAIIAVQTALGFAVIAAEWFFLLRRH